MCNSDTWETLFCFEETLNLHHEVFAAPMYSIHRFTNCPTHLRDNAACCTMRSAPVSRRSLHLEMLQLHNSAQSLSHSSGVRCRATATGELTMKLSDSRLKKVTYFPGNHMFTILVCMRCHYLCLAALPISSL